MAGMPNTWTLVSALLSAPLWGRTPPPIAPSCSSPQGENLGHPQSENVSPSVQASWAGGCSRGSTFLRKGSDGPLGPVPTLVRGQGQAVHGQEFRQRTGRSETTSLPRSRIPSRPLRGGQQTARQAGWAESPPAKVTLGPRRTWSGWRLYLVLTIIVKVSKIALPFPLTCWRGRMAASKLHVGKSRQRMVTELAHGRTTSHPGDQAPLWAPDLSPACLSVTGKDSTVHLGRSTPIAGSRLTDTPSPVQLCEPGSPGPMGHGGGGGGAGSRSWVCKGLCLQAALPLLSLQVPKFWDKWLYTGANLCQ